MHNKPQLTPKGFLSYNSVVITSEAFASKPQPTRHRMVYALLQEEMAAEGGIHALQLKTRTLEEEVRQVAKQKTQEKAEEKAAAEAVPTP